MVHHTMMASRMKADLLFHQRIEIAYAFTSVEQLMADFWSDIRTLRGSK